MQQMMKNKWKVMLCLIVLTSVFLVSSQSFASFNSSEADGRDENPVETYETSLNRYVYPNGPETNGWKQKNMAEKYAYYEIPLTDLETMSDVELIQAMIDYPFMSEIDMLSVSPDQMDEETKQYVREYMAGKCSAYQELLRRNTFDSALRLAISDRRVNLLPAHFEKSIEAEALSSNSIEAENILFNSFVKVFSSRENLSKNLSLLQDRVSKQ